MGFLHNTPVAMAEVSENYGVIQDGPHILGWKTGISFNQWLKESIICLTLPSTILPLQWFDFFFTLLK